MMKKSLTKSLLVAPVVLWLGGCAMGPAPFGSVPVEDRSLRQPPPQVSPPPPEVEVTPLPRPEPFTPRESMAAEPGQPAAPGQPDAPAAEPAPTETAGQGNPAVVALLDSAANYVNSGELEQAAASLERALRIEPGNAGIWHDLGQIRLHQGQYQQAESLASKSNSLAGNDRVLQARNWHLIAVARRAMGNNAGADAAEAQAVVLERGGR